MDRIINNYTVSYKEDFHRLGEFNTVQITLNYRTFPGKRKSVEMFKRLCDTYPKVRFICHYDFIYQATKYKAFTPEVKKAMLEELAGLLCLDVPNFVGVVMHTDTPFKKEVFSSMFPEQVIDTTYNSKIFNLGMLKYYINQWESLSIESIRELGADLRDLISALQRRKIYLENTVKTSIPCSIYKFPTTFLQDSIYPVKDVFGVCVDTEHIYASHGVELQSAVNLAVDVLPGHGISTMLHLNCIPKEVAPFSNKDRHSHSTIFECTLNHEDAYINIVRSIPYYVPWVREVKGETRDRELKQIEEWQNR
nr:MAG TPA: hypothetical protein [Caudoviricetes sp.]